MISEKLKSEIRATYASFLEQVGGRSRKGQVNMLGWITRALMHTAIQQPKIMIEAGTGTGKTLGYLIPALHCAQATGKQVVVATATVSLQRQLLDKDVPLLADSAGLPVTAKLAKGRRRYLCPIRIENTRFEAGQTTQTLIRPLTDGQRGMVEGLYTHFQSGDWNGDLDDWDDAIDSSLIPMVTSDTSNCRGRRCEAITDCPFYAARDELDDAEIIITNHDLVLSDLGLGGGVVLPAPEDAIYVFDEAHQLADKAIAHQTQNVQIGATLDTLNAHLKRVKETAKMSDFDAGHLTQRLEKTLTQLTGPLAGLQDTVIDWLSGQLNDTPRWTQSASGLHQYRLAPQTLPPEIAALCVQAQGPIDQICADLDSLVEWFRAQAEKNNPEMDAELARTQQAFYAEAKLRYDRAKLLFQRWSHTSSEGAEARWVLLRSIERKSQLEEADPELWFSPASAAEGLDTQLWKRCAGAVLCSATLAINKDFSRAYRSLGLDHETPCYIIDGSFDYPNQGELYLPSYAVDPKDTEAHDQSILRHLNEFWDQDMGALVLFSSKAQLTRIYEAIDNKVAHQVLSQLAMGKGAIVGHHQLRRDQGQTSVIFGLQSFSEGVDFPGHLLTEVVICRLPFMQPDDPVQATYAEWIESQGRRAFSEVTLPLASIRLRQAVGRLIRSEEDHGRVTLLDNRIRSKAYGRQLLDDLPPFKRVGFSP